MTEPFRPAFVHNYDIEIKQGSDFVMGFRALARTTLGVQYLPDTSAYEATLVIRDGDADGDVVLTASDTDGRIILGYTPGVWEATTAYGLGQKVVPTDLNGYVYECTTAGTSDSGEPTWPTTIGDDVTDDSAEWTCVETDALVCNVYIHVPIVVTEALTDWGRGLWDMKVVDDFGHSWLTIDGVARLRRETT